jgi:8-oxo-dGTP pyrophosphatase MutT (NUDIX family)
VSEDVHWNSKGRADKKPSLFHFWKGAKKEAEEELGSVPRKIRFSDTVTYEDGSFTYVTFLVRISSSIKDSWQFELNWENDKAEWFSTDALPQPLHFGLKYVIDNMPEIFD